MAKGHRRNDESERVDETRVAPLDDDLDETEEVRTERTQVPPTAQRDAEAARASAGSSGRKSWGNQTRAAPTTSAAQRAAEFTGLETRMTPPPVPDEDLVEETRVDGLKPPPPPRALEDLGLEGGDDDEGFAAPQTAFRPSRAGGREEGQGLPEIVRPPRPPKGGASAEGQGGPEMARPGRAVTREEGQDLPEIVRPSRGAAREGRGGAPRGGGRDAAKEEEFALPEIIHAGRGAELDGSTSEAPRAPRADMPAKPSRPEPMIFAPLPSAQAASQAAQTPELRTMFATHSALLAERLKAELQHKIYGRSPHRILRVDEPEGPSTAGGKQARQAISLVDRKGTAPALVAGWVDVAKGQASLRNHEAVAKRYEFQHGSPLELVPEEYEKFLTDVDEVLRTAAIQVRILVPDESAPTRATVGPQAPRATGVAVRWVLLLVVVAFLLGLAAGATLLHGG